MKKILILGGTNFIGRNLVERLLEIEGYEITLFNRQITHSKLFPNVHKIKGDRETDDIKQIADNDWNYVVDLSCYFPDSLKRTLNSLKTLDKYLFISTCSVYDNDSNQSLLRDEQSKILDCNSEQKTDRSPETYGNRKAECERILKSSGIPHVILRPALVFGKYDPTDRLYYWLYHVKKKNVLLLPENGERIFSTTYVSDLAETIIRILKHHGNSETFNVITNPETSIRQIVDIGQHFIKGDFYTINGSADFLKNNNISQWTDMPLWLNCDYYTYSNQKLLNQLDLQLTDFKTCIKATINYYKTLKWQEPKYGMTDIRRKELINKIETSANKI